MAPKKEKAPPPSYKRATSGGGKQIKEIRSDSKRSKGKQKEEVNTAVLFDQANCVEMLSEVPMYSQITPSVIFERLDLNFEFKLLYGAMKHSPRCALQFYEESSMLARPDPHGAMDIIPTLHASKKEKALSPSSKCATSGSGKQKKAIRSESKRSKGKQKEKVNTAVLFDQANYVKMLSEVTMYNQITPSVMSERLWQLKPEKVLTRGSSVAPNQSVAAGSKPSAQMQKNSYDQATPAGTTPTLSRIPESAQLAMAINASIQSAIAEGVPVDLSDLCMRSDKTGDSNEDSSNKTIGSCVICLDAPVEGACSPCGHMAGCMSCLNMIEKKKGTCPVCCAKIDQVLRLYTV